jgi:GT2 family glycosyltransferase
MPAQQRSKHTAERSPADPRLTVVIATKDRKQSLLTTLHRLTELDERPAIVVVDNGSQDGTADAVRSAFPSVKIVSLDHNHGIAARNFGVRAAQTPYVAFCDDDSWWSPGALTQAADLLDRCPRLAVVAARTVVGAERRTDPVSSLMARSPLRAAGTDNPAVLGFLACSAIVRRQAFLDVGGFAAFIGIGGEERLLAYDLAAAGWELAYVDSIIAHHHPEERDRSARAVLARRNDLLIVALRRPWPTVLAEFTAAARRAVHDQRERRALGSALRAAPAVLPKRRAVPARVEAAIRRLATAEQQA